MLQSIRDNSQSIIAKIIVGLIILTFALWGVQSLISLTQRTKAPATVNGEDIGAQDLSRGVELQRRQILAQMGQNADPSMLNDKLIRSQVLNNLIEQSVLVQSAKEQGMMVSPQMIDQTIVGTSQFQVDGKFNRDQFQSVLRTVGLTPLTYRDYLRKETLIGQERAGYQLSAFVTDGQLDRMMQLDRQTRDLGYFQLPIAPVKAEVKVSEDEVAKWYKAHQAQYKTPEQVRIQYLLLDKAQLAKDVKVTDQDLQDQYQQALAGFTSKQERDASHILIEVSGNKDASAAKAEAEALKKQLDAGADFATLAKQKSDDVGSASKGGELGLNPRGVFAKPFEDALFAIKKEGEVVGPIKTQYGYHLIRLNKIVESKPPSFDEMKSKLREEIIDKKAETRYADELDKLTDLAFSSGTLQEPADELKLKIQTSQPFGRSGGSDPVTSNKRVVDTAFSSDLLNDGVNSSPIELDPGRSVVIRVKDHLMPRQQTLDEVSDSIRSELVDEKATAKMAETVKDLLAKLRDGASLDDVAKAAGQSVTRVAGVDRRDQKLPGAISSELFRLPHPAKGGASFGSVELSGGDKAIVALTAVNSPKAGSITDADRTAMRRFLASQEGQRDYQDLVRSLKDSAEIKIN